MIKIGNIMTRRHKTIETIEAPEYTYVAKCKFCGTTVYSNGKIKVCDACGSTDISNCSVEQFEKKVKKETSYIITPAKPEKTIKTISSLRKKKAAAKKFNWIKLAKIATVVAYVITSIITIVTSLI